MPESANRWGAYIERYQRGEWRDSIFRDIITAEARRLSRLPTLLDIGCGRGFDAHIGLQQSLVSVAGHYIGIEPDETVTPAGFIPEVHRCLLEEATIDPESVDVAFAVMVLEHLPKPQGFWDKLHKVLKPGGVFWGVTVDARHWYCTASLFMERLAFKDIYLNLLLGHRGSDRYENYPVFYRCNHPTRIARYARRFQSCECINFGRIGQLNACLPRQLQPLVGLVDRWMLSRRQPGSLLAVRAVK
jgi:SAM-dependent methyltransferase